jgi:hypothetical protein
MVRNVRAQFEKTKPISKCLDGHKLSGNKDLWRFRCHEAGKKQSQFKAKLESPRPWPKQPEEPVFQADEQARGPKLPTKDLTVDLLSCYNNASGGVSWADTPSTGTVWYAGRLPKAPAHTELCKGFYEVSAEYNSIGRFRGG